MRLALFLAMRHGRRVDLESVLVDDEGNHPQFDQPLWLVELYDGCREVGFALGNPVRTSDEEFIAFLKLFGRFGFFTFGPITIDVGMVEDIFWRTAERGNGDPHFGALSELYVAHCVRFWEEFRKSGRPRMEPIHMLLAYMRCPDGLPARVFGELGVLPEAIEHYAARLSSGLSQDEASSPTAERLYSTEEAAAYFNVHIQTVRVWIRTGKLTAFRLAGQKAIRIRERDLKAVLEPIEPSDLTNL